MEIVFSQKFYKVYSHEPAAEPGRMEAIVRELKGYEFVEPKPADEKDVLLVHTKRHFEYIKRDRELFEIAMLAVGGTILSAEIAFREPSFALVRPPGHHASPDSAWGFCYFNNVAIAVKKLLTEGKISKAVIVDFDLHFGDGTANTFRDEPRVIYYHMSGINIEGIAEFLERHEYDIIAVSAGFDRHIDDWGGLLETEDYTEIGRILKEFAEKKCNGKRFAALEGGYNHEVLGKNVKAFLKGFD
ncbi:MAG: histone deacetylase family protein [Archaeoglobaceae archaeon]|nr:histone deacetylase family protein [Archaeoglobaceae archaeon]MDW8117726.1 histone deacetylase family protein [Archaeoglobaceae archaeon]